MTRVVGINPSKFYNWLKQSLISDPDLSYYIKPPSVGEAWCVVKVYLFRRDRLCEGLFHFPIEIQLQSLMATVLYRSSSLHHIYEKLRTGGKGAFVKCISDEDGRKIYQLNGLDEPKADACASTQSDKGLFRIVDDGDKSSEGFCNANPTLNCVWFNNSWVPFECFPLYRRIKPYVINGNLVTGDRQSVWFKATSPTMHSLVGRSVRFNVDLSESPVKDFHIFLSPKKDYTNISGVVYLRVYLTLTNWHMDMKCYGSDKNRACYSELMKGDICEVNVSDICVEVCVMTSGAQFKIMLGDVWRRSQDNMLDVSNISWIGIGQSHDTFGMKWKHMCLVCDSVDPPLEVDYNTVKHSTKMDREEINHNYLPPVYTKSYMEAYAKARKHLRLLRCNFRMQPPVISDIASCDLNNDVYMSASGFMGTCYLLAMLLVDGTSHTSMCTIIPATLAISVCLAIRNLSHRKDTNKALFGRIDGLFTSLDRLLCMYRDSVPLINNVCLVIVSLSVDNDNEALLGSVKDLFTSLKGLLDHYRENTELVNEICNAILHLSNSNENKAKFGSVDGLFTSLKGLLDHYRENTQLITVICDVTRSLSINHDNGVLIGSVEGLFVTFQGLLGLHHTNGDVVEAICCCVDNLSAHPTNVCQMMSIPGFTSVFPQVHHKLII